MDMKSQLLTYFIIVLYIWLHRKFQQDKQNKGSTLFVRSESRLFCLLAELLTTRPKGKMKEVLTQ